MKKRILTAALIPLMLFFFCGCAIYFQRGRRSDVERIQELSSQVDALSRAKSLLESRLAQEIRDNQVRLQMRDKGLVITFVADIVFDSGKDKIKSEAHPTLNKVATVLRENVPDLSVGIEGHTDNVPIQHSPWKSNWELSSARALSVLHYLIKEGRVNPGRLSAIGYGEYQPVASNDSREGRRFNRRVEVVILPEIAKVKDAAQPVTGRIK